MKKKISIILGLGLIVLVTLLIVPSIFQSQNGPVTFVKEAYVGGNGLQSQYITVPIDDDLMVSITNVTKISDTNNIAEIKVYALKIEGVNE